MDQANQEVDTAALLRHVGRLALLDWPQERLEQLTPALAGLTATMRLLLAADVGDAEPAHTFDPRPRGGP